MKTMLEQHWYRRSLTWLTFLLFSLSWIFYLIIKLRYFLYRTGIKRVTHFPVPVIVIGNLTTGGSGKTPLVIFLAQLLASYDYRPGIVSRGVGGKKQRIPVWVDPLSDPRIVGDEAVLLARHSHCPVVIGIDRAAAVRELLANSSCNVVLSDDGLQHYGLGRAIEIIVIDGDRQFGNGCLLPAGPLREPLSRLKRVDMIVQQGGVPHEHYLPMQLIPQYLVSLKDQELLPLTHFQGKTVHAVAGIGNPQRFFDILRQQGLNLMEHVFPDHYLYQSEDFHFSSPLQPVIMTEKDAVKCENFADERFWYLSVTAQVTPSLESMIMKKLKDFRQ
jgi:tetraacyldisaccharide 4'-kinase